MPDFEQAELTRLLQMYPVHALREAWESRKAMRKEELIAEVIRDVPQLAITEFCRIHHGLTKQHTYIFDNQLDNLDNVTDPLVDLNPDSRLYFRRATVDIEEFYIFRVRYEAVIGGPPWDEATFDFLWPVSILVEAAHAIVRFTIIEKSLAPYLPDDMRAVNVHKAFDENTICSKLVEGMPSPGALVRCDIQRGVKALWTSDQIDGEHIRFKAARSTKTEDMDSTFLMKRDDPAAFQLAIAAPLLKSTFKAVGDSNFPPLFAVVPSDGELIVNRYSDTLTEVDNVVRAILAAN